MVDQISVLEKTFLLWVLSRTTNPQLLDHILARLRLEFISDSKLDDMYLVDHGLKAHSLVLQSVQDLT